jgi:hypothetical protein
MAKRSAIGKLASAKTKTQFSDELSSHTSLTSKEIKELFPTKSDREEILELIKIVNSDAGDKRKKAELIAKIGKVGGAVLKITKKIVTGL